MFNINVRNRQQQNTPSKRRGQWLVSKQIVSYLILYLLISTLTACSSIDQVPSNNETAAPTQLPVQIITLHYNERPPYLVVTDNGVEGLTGQPATNAFEKSKISFQWVQTPTQRQLYLLQQNSGQDCFVGWFKTPERAAYAKYTLPIYQDRPQVGLTRADNDNIPAASSISEIFSDRSLTLLVKAGYSYGEFIDRSIKNFDPVIMETTSESGAMLNIISAKHADYFFVAPEEAQGLISASDFNRSDFKYINFEDVPQGEYRYIMCSAQVDDYVINQLNAAIARYDLNISNEQTPASTNIKE